MIFTSFAFAQDYGKYLSASIPRPSMEAVALTKTLLANGIAYIDSVEITITESTVLVSKKSYWLNSGITLFREKLGLVNDYSPKTDDISPAKSENASLFYPDAVYGEIDIDGVRVFHPSFMLPEEGWMDISTVLLQSKLDQLKFLRVGIETDIVNATTQNKPIDRAIGEDALKRINEYMTSTKTLEDINLSGYKLHVKRSELGTIEEIRISNEVKGFLYILRNKFYKTGYPVANFKTKSLKELVGDDMSIFGITAKELQGKIFLEADTDCSRYLYGNVKMRDFFLNEIISVNGSKDFTADSINQILKKENEIEIEVKDRFDATKKFKFKKPSCEEAIIISNADAFKYPSENFFE